MANIKLINERVLECVVPKPVYPCAVQGCADECSWPAEDLYYYPVQKRPGCIDERAGFYCENCVDFVEMKQDPMVGRLSLQEYFDLKEALSRSPDERS